MAPRRALAAVAAVLAGLALAGEAHSPGQRAAHAAAEHPPMPHLLGPQTCAIAVDRCSAEPCIQFVRDRRRCDAHPDAAPRMIPVR